MNNDLLNSASDGHVVTGGSSMPYGYAGMTGARYMNGYSNNGTNSNTHRQTLSGPDGANSVMPDRRIPRGKQGGCGCKNNNRNAGAQTYMNPQTQYGGTQPYMSTPPMPYAPAATTASATAMPPQPATVQASAASYTAAMSRYKKM